MPLIATVASFKMSDQTLEAPSVEVPAAPPLDPAPKRDSPWLDRPWVQFLRRNWWIPAAAVVLIISLLVVLWARSRPGYDPYGWLVWGKLTFKGALDTNGAPSWKPLAYLFTVPFSIFGHYSLWLWMVFSVAVSLSGLIFAWRIAFRLTGSDPAHRYASYVAGLFAALAVFGMQDVVSHLTYAHYVLSAESDTMIVALVLAAVDFHLTGHHRVAFVMWVLASLGRPEVWPFLAGAVLFLIAPRPGEITYREPRVASRLLRVPLEVLGWLPALVTKLFDDRERAWAKRAWLWIGGTLLFLFFMWFFIPGISSKSFFTAGNIAHNSPRMVHGNKITGTISRFHALEANTVWVLAGLAVLVAAWRRWWTILALAAGALLWLVIEIAFSIKGYPSVPRYMFEAGAIVAVLAGVAVGRLILEVPPLIGRVVRDLAPKAKPRVVAQLGGWGAAIVVVALAGSMFGAARTQIRHERVDLRHERARAKLFNKLSTVVDRLTPARILRCGQPNIPISYQSVFAWYMGINTGVLYVNPSYLKTHPHPLVSFYPTTSGGWKVFPSHIQTAAQAARCRHLKLTLR
jgi:hypothetical protein